MNNLTIACLLKQFSVLLEDISQQVNRVSVNPHAIIETTVLLAYQQNIIKFTKELLRQFAADDPLMKDVLEYRLFEFELDDMLAKMLVR